MAPSTDPIPAALTRRKDGTVRTFHVYSDIRVTTNVRGPQSGRYRLLVIETTHADRYVARVVRQRSAASGGGDYKRGGQIVLSSESIERDDPATAARIRATLAARP